MIALLSSTPDASFLSACVLAPIVGAAAAAAIPHARASWAVAFAALALAAAASGVVALRRLFGAASIERDVLTLDGVGAFALLLVLGSVAVVVFAAGGVLRDMQRRAGPFALALALCAAAGWAGALTARDVFGLAVSAEAAWLASAGLVALSSTRRGALNGALRMVSAGGAAAVLMLLGAALVTRGAGGTALSDLAEVELTGAATAGVALMLLSLAVKAGLAPLHVWAGAAYGRSGALATSFVGVVGVAGALAVIIRLSAHATEAFDVSAGAAAALAALGAASIVIGSVQAVGATNVSRLAGYAIASQAGCVLLACALGSPAGYAAALVQIVALAAAALALFLGAAVAGDMSLEALNGLGRRNPIAGVALMAGALSLMGAPLTIGFLGRWRLIEAAVGAGWWWAAGTALIASLAAVIYGGRLIERLYFRRSTQVREAERDASRLLLAPALLIAIAGLAWGVDPSFLLNAAARAAALMFGHAP